LEEVVRWRVLCIDEFNTDTYWTPPSSPPTMADWSTDEEEEVRK
jgi:hypothetical protein